MIPELPGMPCPDWISEIAAEPERAMGALPVSNILADSLYYPASEFDGDPVEFLAGNVFSFVYADRHGSKEDFERAFERGFLGYRPIPRLRRYLKREEIASADTEEQAYAHWSVWKRTPEYDESHGPRLFSLLFLGWDALAAFESLYIAYNEKPKIIAIISPGIAPLRVDSAFKRRVMENPAGPPDYLLCNQGSQPRPSWPEYGTLIAKLPERCANLWALGGKAPEIDDETTELPE